MELSLSLLFASGIHVKGTVTDIVKNDKKNCSYFPLSIAQLLITPAFLFDASWGAFDMAVGSQITSVFPGAADAAAFFPNG